MISHIFGDSHARNCFSGMPDSVNHAMNSVTMHRVGRDGLQAVNCKASGVNEGDNIFFIFGEVDCRCHIQRQVDLGRQYEEVMTELVNNYFRTIRENVQNFSKLNVIIVSVVPPVLLSEFHAVNPPIPDEHPFPFVGSDERRIQITRDMNRRLRSQAQENSYHFLDINTPYSRPDGSLKFELSDTICHIRENSIVLQEAYKLISKLL